MRELTNIEEKILDRALYLIGKNRSCNISIRAIAKEANVNVSAINYYFRTKEEMLRQAKQFFINNTLAISSIMDDDRYDDEQKLILAANETMEYTLRFPGITVLLREASNIEIPDDISKGILQSSQEMLEKMSILLRNIIKGDSVKCKYRQTIFVSSIVYPVENNDVINFDETIINSKEHRIEYIKYLIRALKAD